MAENDRSENTFFARPACGLGGSTAGAGSNCSYSSYSCNSHCLTSLNSDRFLTNCSVNSNYCYNSSCLYSCAPQAKYCSTSNSIYSSCCKTLKKDDKTQSTERFTRRGDQDKTRRTDRLTDRRGQMLLSHRTMQCSWRRAQNVF